MSSISSDLPFLAVDAGSTFTKAFVLDEVDGERRLVAVGRSATLADDGQAVPDQAAARAVAQALAIAGRDATGARVHAVQRSLPAAPRVLVIAAREEMARRALEGLSRLPLRLLDPVLLAPNSGAAAEQVLAAIEAQTPDALVFAGSGTDGAGRPLRAAVEAVRYGLSGAAPHIVTLGDDAFASGMAPLLEGLRGESASLDDLDAIAQAVGPLLTGSSLDGVRVATEMVAERYDVDVLTLDLGASHALAVVASGTTGKRRVTSVVRDDLGLRRGRTAILETAGADAVLRWMPVDVSLDALRGDARRGAIAPASVPETPEELLLDHAFAREALTLLLAGLRTANGVSGGGLPPIDLLIGSGGVLASAPRLIQAALVLLDAVQPEALTQLALDRATALPLLGHLGVTLGHQGVGAALERDGLLNLGLCIAPAGSGREGETAIRVEVAYATRSPVTVEVPFGAIEVVPLAAGERAALKLWPARDFDVGLGRGNAATPRAEVEGGAVGIIIDARGRPLVLPESTEKRQAKLLQWFQATHAYPPLSFVQSEDGAAVPGGEA